MSEPKVTGDFIRLNETGETFKIPGLPGTYYSDVDISAITSKDGDQFPAGNIRIKQARGGLFPSSGREVFADQNVATLDPITNEINCNNAWINGASAKEKDAIKSHINEIKKSTEIALTKNLAQQNAGEGNPITQDDLVKADKDAKKLLKKGGETISDIEEGTAKMAARVEKQTEKAGTRRSFGNHAYPIDLAKTGEDVIKFSMLEYSPKKFKRTSESKFGKFEDRKDRKPVGSVCLPIPGGIQDNNACDWGGNSMNAFQAGLAQVALTAIQEGLGDGADAAANAVTGLFQDPTTKNTLASFIASNAAGASGFELLTRTTGAIVNPNLELLFQRPTLRPFSFQFKLTPRDEREQNEIIKILRFFKQGMAPIRTQSQLYLKSPHTFRIQYIQDNSEHQFLHKFKECALQTFNVNYTPDGNYSTYESGVMTSYVIRMQLQELSPVFNDEYENDSFAPSIRGTSGTDITGRDFDDPEASNFGLGNFSSADVKNDVPTSIGF